MEGLVCVANLEGIVYILEGGGREGGREGG